MSQLIDNIQKISFLGLGVMGYPMAGHLQRKTDLEVTVFNRSAGKAIRWAEQFGGERAETPEQAAAEADIVFTCVGRDEDLREVLTGEHGVVHSLKEGGIVVDHTTVSAEISREMNDVFSELRCHFMDAPISGGQAGAENGCLTVMCGGAQEVFDLVQPLLLDVYAKEMRLIGGAGAGQMAKMCNQICIAGTLQGLSEAVDFGMKAGLNMDEVFETLGKGAAQSWQMDNRGKTMVRDEFDFGFALDWMIKDLSIALAEAKSVGASTELTEDVLNRYKTLSEDGLGRMDTSALVKALK